MANIGALIRRELEKAAPDRNLTLKGDNAWICCPHPDHAGGNESSPSLAITLEGDRFAHGFWHCFGCGKSGMWPTLAPLLKLRTLKNAVAEAAPPITSAQRDRLLGRTLAPSPELAIPWGSETWRGISGEVVSQVGGSLVYVSRLNATRLRLPVTIDGETAGLIYAQLEKPASKRIPSYVYSPGQWATSALFPYDHVAGMLAKMDKRVLLVGEGSRDALNPIQHGLPALALLTTGAADHPSKVALILDLEPDIVLVATDPDDAGRKAAKALTAALKGKVATARLKMAPDTDPGKFTRRQVARILERFG